MKKRTREILVEIIKSKEITISQLAESFGVSERTIRNDLNNINNFLEENDLSAVSIGSGKKIQHEEDIKQAINLVTDKDFYSYKLSKEERKSMIAILLIESSEYITLSKIADTLFVSRATIINDLSGVKEFLKSGNLTVISHANKGLRLEGLESDKRFFLLNMITADRNNINLFTSLNKDNVLFKEEVEKIHKIINEQEHAHESYLTDNSYNRLKNYLTIAVSRIECGELIETQQEINNTKYAMAQDILKYMSQYLGFIS
ncbi:BglG family transcription antiterminator, partial [Intestinibacter sp.]